jgi:hypothetical protein
MIDASSVRWGTAVLASRQLTRCELKGFQVLASDYSRLRTEPILDRTLPNRPHEGAVSRFANRIFKVAFA